MMEIQIPETADTAHHLSGSGRKHTTRTQEPSSPITSCQGPPAHNHQHLSELFAENIIAKIYRSATTHLTTTFDENSSPNTKTTSPRKGFPQRYPEYVPQEGKNAGTFVLRESEFWTCGFFPGTVHSMLERLIRFPESVHLPTERGLKVADMRSHVLSLCDLWAEPLHNMAYRRDTHDVGFIIMPALQKDWELTGNTRSLESIIRAARSLASRYVPGAQAIRSWDARVQKNIQITCQSQNAILIIDSMCNLDLLYYAASHSSEGGAELYDIATSHATTLLRTHLRQEKTVTNSKGAYLGQWYSTHHVANVSPSNGTIQQQFTAQGYSDTSTWARGQAWGILGYAQTYTWTKDKKFLDAACGLAEYFIHRMETRPGVQVGNTSEGMRVAYGRYVPLWDFDAPVDDPSNPTRDSSAAAIAANGMLIISQAMKILGDGRLALRFRDIAVDVVRDLLDFALAPETAKLVENPDGAFKVEDVVHGETFEALMKYGTVNNNINAMRRYANHGIVYGDYYLVEFGNRLLRMGL